MSDDLVTLILFPIAVVAVLGEWLWPDETMPREEERTEWDDLIDRHW